MCIVRQLESNVYFGEELALISRAQSFDLVSFISSNLLGRAF